MITSYKKILESFCRMHTDHIMNDIISAFCLRRYKCQLLAVHTSSVPFANMASEAITKKVAPQKSSRMYMMALDPICMNACIAALMHA